MIKKFEYSNSLIHEFKTEHRKRVIFFIILTVPFWGFAFFNRHDYIATLCAIGFTFILFLFDFLLNKFARRATSFIGQTIEVEDRVIRQISRNGNILCEINLEKDFQISYPYHACGNAIYCIKRNQKRLMFSSRINNAERLVKDVLGHDEWPPGDNETA
jgi:hypothetical protein